MKFLDETIASSGGLRDYRAEIMYGAFVSKCFVNQEYSSSSFLLKLLCLTVVICIYPIKTTNTGTSQDPFVWGCKANLPEFTWSVSCSIVTDYYGDR